MQKYKSPGRNTKNTTRKRIILIGCAFLLFLSVLIGNLFSLQYVNYSYYKNKVYDQITTVSTMKAKRGNIYDANMNLLATDKTVWRIFVSTKDIRRESKRSGEDIADKIARGLSPLLSLDREVLYKKISNTSVLDVTVKRNVDEQAYRKVLTFAKSESLEGLILAEAQSSRYYPESTLASHVIGFVGSDLQGLYGLEYSYNDTLSGKDGYYYYGKDANGSELPTEYATYIPAEDGYSIVTTIDSYVQSVLEGELETIRVNHGVQNRVTGIVMDTSTGAILAMATTSPFDPNSPYVLDTQSQAKLDSSTYPEDSEEYRRYKKELLEIMWSNKAVSEIYEPGSTFKIATVSAALDKGVATVNDTFSCHGYLSVGGWNIRCHKVGGHGSGFNLAYGLQMSCNPTMMTIAERLGAEAFYDYVEAFGYLEKTGIDLPSEANGIFHKEENIGTTELATASFGQRFKVSVIRQLTSVAAIANGGELLEPYLVSKVIDSAGNVISERKTTAVRRVVSEEVAATVSDILEKGVSGDGGAKNAAVEGYKIAAKTGTSQKFDILDENGNSYLRISSTVAFSMSNEGGIAVIIVADEPTSAVKYGSVVAAPYVSSFLAKALPYLGYRSEAEETKTVIENFVGTNVAYAKMALSDMGIKYEIIGDGDIVLSQTPTSEYPLTHGNSRVILYTTPSKEIYVEVPDVVGLELSRANELILNSGLNICVRTDPESSGATVTYQSIPAGAVVKKGMVLEIEIVYTDFED